MCIPSLIKDPSSIVVNFPTGALNVKDILFSCKITISWVDIGELKKINNDFVALPRSVFSLKKDAIVPFKSRTNCDVTALRTVSQL